jgi:hypothetical protein
MKRKALWVVGCFLLAALLVPGVAMADEAQVFVDAGAADGDGGATGACCYTPAGGTTKCAIMTASECVAADTGSGIGVMYYGANAMKNCKQYCSGESWMAEESASSFCPAKLLPIQD